MTELSDVIFVWGTTLGGEPAGLPTVSVSAWPHLFGKTWLRDHGEVAQAAKAAQVAFVNLLPTADGLHVEVIKQANPECYVVAMPDPPLEMVLTHNTWNRLWTQLASADALACRTRSDCDVYGSLLNKPTYYLPSPLGPEDFYDAYWNIDKSDYVITLDHSMDQPNTALNIAACVELQRKTGCRIVYCAERDWTKHQAATFGLEAEFRGYVPWRDFVELTARARLCVDMYASHSYGRQAVMCAALGTPCITSTLCEDAPGLHVDPYNPFAAASVARSLLENVEEYELVRVKARSAVRQNFYPNACRRRMFGLLAKIKANQRIKA